MRVQRISPISEVPLWQFVTKFAPHGMRLTRCDNGYGQIVCLELKERGIASYIPFRDPIARIGDDEIELFHPQYFSDISDLITAYEKDTGRMVVLKYWESA